MEKRAQYSLNITKVLFDFISWFAKRNVLG